MTGDSDWSLPSESERVQALLYLAEGIIVAGGATFFLLQIVMPFLNVVSTLIDGNVLSLVLALPIIVFLVGRVLLPLLVTEWDADWPPEYQDWGETRRWGRIAIIALVISAIQLGVLVLLWRRWSILSFGETYFASVGMVLSGFLLHLYVFHRIRSTE